MNPTIELVGNELAWFSEVRAGIYQDLFPPQDNLYPLPFFGDIRRAEVLSLALNPSHLEFTDTRRWPRRVTPMALSAEELTTRLLHYYDLPEPQPHPWFKRVTEMLLCVQCAYIRNAAHVDLISLPTLRPQDMRNEQRANFVEVLRQYSCRLDKVLPLARRTKVLLVFDFRINDGMGGHTSVWQMLQQKCSLVASRAVDDAVDDGLALPILRSPSFEGLADLVFQKRYEIREYLNSGAFLCD